MSVKQYMVEVLPEDPGGPFPDPLYCEHPEGLVAIGGDLSKTRLVNAYTHGIFPWYEPDGPILWWSPDPRAVLIPGHVHVSRRLKRTIRQGVFTTTVDRDFEAVIEGCAAPRPGTSGTWITAAMQDAYLDLHRAGIAHSIEVWHGDELAGGLYGVALGAMFYAESKFHVRTDASKVALVDLMARLERSRFLLCDCQLWNPHLQQFNVRLLARPDFLRLLRHAVALPDRALDESC